MMCTVFLSYSHDDNLAPEGSGRRGWVSFFDESLGIELRERGLLDIKVWRDQRDFDKMGAVKQKLDAGLTASQIMLAVMSPLYVQKEYCLFELEGFLDHQSRCGSNDPRDRVLVVLKRSVSDDRFPPRMRGTGYIPFFEINRERNQDELFFGGYGTNISPKYWTAIQEVATHIERHCAALVASRNATAPDHAAVPAEAAEAPSNATVYLAEPPSDLSDVHWGLQKELESQGCRIVPTNPWPSDFQAAEQHLRDAVDQAQFSIHLLGATSGSDAPSGLTSLAKLQLDLAAERLTREPTFRRLIWVRDGLQPTEPQQQQLIASLDDGTSLRPQDELIRGGLEGFKEEIRNELTRHAAPKAQPTNLYLICEQMDEAEALALRPALAAAGFAVEVPEFEGLAVPAAEHERCLRTCESVLLFWGKGSEGQVRKRLSEIDGAVATLRQGRRYAARGLYLAPPESPRKVTFPPNLVDVVLAAPADMNKLRRDGTRPGARQ